jgi:hypothetical protein
LFFFVSFSVGKNQMCLTERWLFTLTHNVEYMQSRRMRASNLSNRCDFEAGYCL